MMRKSITYTDKERGGVMKLTEAVSGKRYTVSSIEADDEELLSFLFTLGCYGGEPITVVKTRRDGAVVLIKDGRYNIDKHLADAIVIEE